MAHLSMESEKKRSELLKFIQNYESYKKISRRNKSAQKEQQPVKEWTARQQLGFLYTL